MPLVDLDDPEELRARWSALAAVGHATGSDRRWYADENGWHHQDETGSDVRMVRLEGGRAVLFGFHTQHTQTAEANLLAGSPPWIGQPEVKRRIAAGDLGFVYGSFNGTWARASYPGDPWQPLDDGFLPIGESITSDEEAAREMIEWAAEWADYLGGLDELLPVGVRLIRAAATTGITLEPLLELFNRLGIGPHSPQQPDLRAALAAAVEFEHATSSSQDTAGVGGSQSVAATRYPAAAATPAAPATPAAGYSPGPAGASADGYAPASDGYASAGARADGYSPADPQSEQAPADPHAGYPNSAPGGFEAVDEGDDEESFIVPPGISPFTGQPIGDDANLIIGGSEPYTPEPRFTHEPPFTPEPPLTPEPPFRPDSPFAPDPQPYTPEPPYAPEPASEPPYQPEDAGARVEKYGVVAKKPRLFRRRKHDEAGPAAHAAPPAPTGTLYVAPAQPEPPRVGGPVDDGEDFYASLFADAPAAASYMPDVIRDAPAEPEAWSADDATSEFAAAADDTAAADPLPSVSASDDTGVIPPIPAAEDASPDPFEPTPDPSEPAPQLRETTQDRFESHSRPLQVTVDAGQGPLDARQVRSGSRQGPLDAGRNPLDARLGSFEAVEPEPEPEPESEAAPESPAAPAQREWIGGAWINGEWIEDVAAYLAAQNAAGPAKAAPPEAQPVEDPAQANPAEEPPTEDRRLYVREFEQSAEEPPTEEWVLGLSEFEQFADEPPTEERFLELSERSEVGRPGEGSPAEERLLEVPAEERLLGAPAEDQLLGIPMDDQLVGVPVEETLSEDPVERPVAESLEGEEAQDAESAADEPVVEVRESQGEVEDEAPTAEIAAVTEQDPEDEYYASNGSPFAPATRDLPPNGFSSLEPLGDFDYRMGDEAFHGEAFHDEIPGDADWTADQLGEPQEAAAVEVTGQLAPIQEAEPQHAGESHTNDLRADEPQTNDRQVDQSQLDDLQLVDLQIEQPQMEEPRPDERRVAEHRPDERRADEFRAEELTEESAGEPAEEVAEAGARVEAPVAERPEKLVVPDPGGGAVAIPGLGVVGGDGPRVEPRPGSIEEAMRAEIERPRPRPKEAAAFKALHDWCRARTKIVPSGFTIQVQVLDPSAPSYRFDLEPPEIEDPQYGAELLTDLLGDLWLTEEQGEQGGWLFARIDVAGRTVRIDRWYDSVPDWWDNPVEARLDVHGLVRRLNGRGPDWQPSYLEKLYTTAR